jgi:hypothetical protein
VAFGAILLDDFLRYLENPAGFTTVTTSAAAAINLKPLTKGWVPFARSGRAPFTLSKAEQVTTRSDYHKFVVDSKILEPQYW